MENHGFGHSARAPVKDVLEAAEEAGRQLVRDGKMSEKTLSIVSQELVPLEMYVQGHILNRYLNLTQATKIAVS